MPNFVTPDKNILTPQTSDFSEVARYLGYRRGISPDSQIQGLIYKACNHLLSVINPQGIFECFDLSLTFDSGIAEIKFADIAFNSVDLSRNLKNCNKVYLMAATIGPQVDALIRRANANDPTYAAVLQASGAMYIEKFVDFINDLIKENVSKSDGKTKPRYSPGFGDVSLNLQKEFFRLLPCARIGLSLMDTLIMAPEKSVTAFIGVMESGKKE